MLKFIKKKIGSTVCEEVFAFIFYLEARTLLFFPLHILYHDGHSAATPPLTML